MYIILKGQINILKGSPEFQENTSLISALKEGQFFGELALVHKGAYRKHVCSISWRL